MTSVVYKLIVLAKLCTASAAEPIAWQTLSLHRSFCISTVLGQPQYRTASLTSSATDPKGDRDAFYQLELQVKSIRRWYKNNFTKAKRRGQEQVEVLTHRTPPMQQLQLRHDPMLIQTRNTSKLPATVST